MVTTTLPGVVPFVGDSDNHWPPPDVMADALNATDPPPAIETVTVCAAGLAPPIWKVTGLSEAGLTERVAFGAMVNVTAIVCGLLATVVGCVAVRVTVAVYVPVRRPNGFTVMVRLVGVTPVDVLT